MQTGEIVTEQDGYEATEISVSKTLQAQVTPVIPEDTMAEAGRKTLLVNFIDMLEHEDGSRTGEDIENVHKMRVATRRMRSALRLFGEYYKPKAIDDIVDGLKATAKHLGAIRDLDVMIENLEAYTATTAGDTQDALHEVLLALNKRRAKARKRLVKYLDGNEYHQFVERFAKFATKPGKGAVSVDESSPAPYQVRHIIPMVIHGHLSEVRAYDNVLEDATPTTLHSLRIECKRLRYATSFFTDILGRLSHEFIEEVKTIQDHLGHLNDVVVAKQLLSKLELNDAQSLAIEGYLTHLEASQEQALQGFTKAWERFNSRQIQSKISNALLALK